jgi:DNA-binding XRE family transcriptional regulator
VKHQKELNEFSGRVKALRKAKKMTQLALADILEVDVRTIKNLEAGSYNPTLQLVFGIAKAFKVDARELF